MDKMEHDTRFSKGFGYRIFRECCHVYYTQGPYQNLDLAIKYTMESLRENRPDFDIEEMESYFLSDNERYAIASLATIYRGLCEFDKEIKYRYKLIENYEKNYSATLPGMRTNYCAQISNLACALRDLKRYEECIEVANKGLAVAASNTAAVDVYMKILYFKACALLFLGRKDEGEPLYKRYIFYAYSLGENQNPDIAYKGLKEGFEEVMGYQLDLTLPWRD